MRYISDTSSKRNVSYGYHLEREAQGVVKMPVKPSASPLDSALRHGIALASPQSARKWNSTFKDKQELVILKKAAEIAKDREKWKSLRSSKRC